MPNSSASHQAQRRHAPHRPTASPQGRWHRRIPATQPDHPGGTHGGCHRMPCHEAKPHSVGTLPLGQQQTWASSPRTSHRIRAGNGPGRTAPRRSRSSSPVRPPSWGRRRAKAAWEGRATADPVTRRHRHRRCCRTERSCSSLLYSLRLTVHPRRTVSRGRGRPRGRTPWLCPRRPRSRTSCC